MSNSFILISGLLILIGLYVYNNYNSIQQSLCPKCPDCPKCPECKECPECPVTNIYAMNVLKQLAKGCSQRLRGVLRESAVSKNDVKYFLNGGDKRVVVVTNMVPETFTDIVKSADEKELATIKAIVLGSANVSQLKTYMVMSINNGKMSPLGSPTTVFDDAFEYLEKKTLDISKDNDNLVLYIDEDINCENKTIEKCCGKRHEGLAVLNDSENLTYEYGNSMFNYYINQRNL